MKSDARQMVFFAAIVAAVACIHPGCKRKPTAQRRDSRATRKWLDHHLKQVFGPNVSVTPDQDGGRSAFRIAVAEGVVALEVSSETKMRRIKVTFKNISLTALYPKNEALPLTGKLEGNGTILVPTDTPSAVQGRITFRCDRCAIGGGTIRPQTAPGESQPAPSGLTLPKLQLGRFGGTIKIANGEASIDRVEAQSADIELEVSATIQLRTPLGRSTVEGHLRFKFADDLKYREPKWAVVETILRRARRKDGYFWLSTYGRLSKLRIRPSGDRKTGGRRARP